MSTNPTSTKNDESEIDKSKIDKSKIDESKIDKGRVVVSWTGGKDGCFACYRAISKGFEVSHLLNFREIQRRGSHDISPDLVYAQSEALGIPLIHKDFVSYEQEFKKVVCNLRDSGENNASLAEEFRTDHK